MPSYRQTAGTFLKLSAICVAHRQLPVQYQAIRTGSDATRNFEIVHLVRLTMSPPSTMASVYFPAMNGFGGIGISPPIGTGIMFLELTLKTASI